MASKDLRKYYRIKMRRYRRTHRKQALYTSSRCSARTFFKRYIKSSDIPEFEKHLQQAKARLGVSGNKTIKQ